MRALAALLTMILFAVAAPVRAGEVAAVEKGSPLRTEILDAMRPTFAAQTGGPVEFVVTTLNTFGDWAYADVKLQRPGGEPLNWEGTRYAEDFRAGMFDPEHNLALLQQGAKGWRVVEYQLGPTDIAWDSWRTQYDLPKEFFTQ